MKWFSWLCSSCINKKSFILKPAYCKIYNKPCSIAIYNCSKFSPQFKKLNGLTHLD